MNKVFIAVSLLLSVVSVNAYAWQNPYVVQMQNQTLLMQQQNLNAQRAMQQQQYQYNQANTTQLDTSIPLRTNVYNYADTYAQGYAIGQQQRLMELQIAREQAELEAAQAQAVKDESEAKMAKLLAEARARHGVTSMAQDIDPAEFAQWEASQPK